MSGKSSSLKGQMVVGLIILALILMGAVNWNRVAGEFTPLEKGDVRVYLSAKNLINGLKVERDIVEKKFKAAGERFYLIGTRRLEREFPVKGEGPGYYEADLLEEDYAMDMIFEGMADGKTTYEDLLPVFEKIKKRAETEIGGNVEQRLQRQSVYEANGGLLFGWL